VLSEEAKERWKDRERKNRVRCVCKCDAVQHNGNGRVTVHIGAFAYFLHMRGALFGATLSASNKDGVTTASLVPAVEYGIR
jgi:hypothetical protein